MTRVYRRSKLLIDGLESGFVCALSLTVLKYASVIIRNAGISESVPGHIMTDVGISKGFVIWSLIIGVSAGIAGAARLGDVVIRVIVQIARQT
jgi:hypothetical protein